MPRHMTGRRPRPDPNATLYVVKVALAGEKGVWRRIAVRSNQTLDNLHAVIFRAFDRFEEHLYSFYLAPPGTRGRAALRDAVEYTSPIMIEEANPFGGRPVHNAGITTIGSLGRTARSTLRYLFDFGDSWWHDITVEQTDGKPEQMRYPCVLEKHGASPPQYIYPEEDEKDEELRQPVRPMATAPGPPPPHQVATPRFHRGSQRRSHDHVLSGGFRIGAWLSTGG